MVCRSVALHGLTFSKSLMIPQSFLTKALSSTCFSPIYPGVLLPRGDLLITLVSNSKNLHSYAGLCVETHSRQSVRAAKGPHVFPINLSSPLLIPSKFQLVKCSTESNKLISIMPRPSSSVMSGWCSSWYSNCSKKVPCQLYCGPTDRATHMAAANYQTGLGEGKRKS